ncbi:hypothetical protein M153_4188000314, partial [Pseudoloma neurophilia]
MLVKQPLLITFINITAISLIISIILVNLLVKTYENYSFGCLLLIPYTTKFFYDSFRFLRRIFIKKRNRTNNTVNNVIENDQTTEQTFVFADEVVIPVNDDNTLT